MTVIPISTAPGFAASTPDAPPATLQLPVAPVAFCRMRHAPEDKKAQALNAADVLAAINDHADLNRVELDGPGDPLASMAVTLATVGLVKEHHPALVIGLTSLGLGAAEQASALAAAGVTRCTLLVDTLDGPTAEKLYAWIRPGKKTIPLQTAVPLLLDEQAKAVPALVAAGIAVTIRTTVYPGLNAHQVITIAETLSDLGATAMELVPFVTDAAQEGGPESATRVHMEQIAKLTARFVPTTTHQVAMEQCGCQTSCGCGSKPSVEVGLPKPSKDRPRVAVVSSGGMDVDLHLGQAKTILIYGPREDGLTCLLETRQAPAAGSGEDRWDQLAATLHDCFALLAASAGERPRAVLAGHGIRVLLTEDNIEGSVDVLYGGGKKKKCK